MVEDYTVALRIAVYKGTPETLLAGEESTFANITFAKMAHLSNEFYELVTKLLKEK